MSSARKTISFAAFALASTLVVGVSAPAFAHAQLLVSSPAVGSTLYVAPTSVTLTFDDDLIDLAGGNQIVVTDPSNARVDTGDTVLKGATLSIALRKLTKFGKYLISYHVISNDGHPVGSQFPFYYQAKPTPKAKPAPKPKKKN
ncbi:MAG: hypothetical protein RJA35_488 [Actinomycetota bacterium]|jgi:methionine-rich copper-binding protein CopC